MIGIDGVGYGREFVRSSSDVESQSRCQHLTDAFGGRDTLGIDSAIMMTMQSSLTILKIETFLACEQDPY